MSLLAAALWILATVLGHLALHALVPDANWLRIEFSDIVAGVSVVASLGLFAYARRSTRNPRFILDLGLVYLVLTALALGLTLHPTVPHNDAPVNPVISWAGVAVIMFAAIVPSTPRKTAIAGIVAASMNPLSMLIAGSSWTSALVMHYQDFLLVGVAVVISHVVTRLGHQVSKARALGSYHLASCSEAAGWARCTEPRIGCSRDQRRSS